MASDGPGKPFCAFCAGTGSGAGSKFCFSALLRGNLRSAGRGQSAGQEGFGNGGTPHSMEGEPSMKEEHSIEEHSTEGVYL